MSLHNWSNKKIITEDTSSYMSDQDFDIIEEMSHQDTNKHLAAKLMGIEDIRAQMGRLSPRYIATKVTRLLQKENPQLDISNVSDDDIKKAFAQVKNSTGPEIQRTRSESPAIPSMSTEGYLEKLEYDLIEEARGKKIADPIRAKLMGMEDIRDLKGTMTPRYFATKVIRFLQKENPELDIDSLSDSDIQNAINVIANVSKPLATRSDVKITTRERGAAKEGLKKGDTGFETLQLNLGGDTVLGSEGEVGENDLYTVVSDGLKYRVTLNSFKGQKINLDDISQDDVVSVVIVKPSETEAVDKFGGEIEMGQREKLVADFPEGEEEGDDMDTVISKIMNREVDRPNSDVSHDPREVDPDMPLDVDDRFDPDMEIGPENAECMSDDEENAEIDVEKSDLDNDGDLSEYERKRGKAISDAMEKSKQKDDSNEDELEEDEQIALSPQQINQMMADKYRQNLQRQYGHERLNRHGY